MAELKRRQRFISWKESAAFAHELDRNLITRFQATAEGKAYDHGVSYLKKLDMLAPAVSDWRGFESHDLYLKHLRVQHARKRSFWPRYEK